MELKSKKYVDRYGNVIWKLPNDKLHRLDGPAFEHKNYKAWWVNGKLHRIDGPAVEWWNGDKWWYVDDIRYTNFQSYLEAVKPLITEQEYFILVLTYGTEK